MMKKAKLQAHTAVLGVIVTFCVAMFWSFASASSYLSYVRDLLSTSAPSAGATQTITFTLNDEVPPSGAIDLDFRGGGFVIPASGLTFADIDVGYSDTRGGPYIQRPLSSVRSAGTDGVTVTTGANGRIRINMNTTFGIPANNEVEVKIGTNANVGATGDTNMILTAATGSYPVSITTYDAGNNEIAYSRTMIAVVSPVTIGPVDTTDQTPPVILESMPSGILQVGTRAVEMYLRTDERSSCRYATSSMAYALMPYHFYGTSTGLVFWHFSVVSGLTDDTAYTYYVRCVDFRLNEIAPDYLLEFRVGIAPGEASSTATTTGSMGTGTGTSSATSTGTTNQGGNETGSGSGSSGSGSGSSASGGDSSGSGSGGSPTTGGTKLPQANVRIDGFAYPGATVTFIRDGTIVTTQSAGGGGEFSNLTQGLDRGSYTFGVYAVDRAGVRSATYSTTLWLQQSTLSALSNIMLPPTVAVVENSVQPGTPLSISGYTAPNATVTTWLRPKLAEVSSGDIVSTTTASASGAWSLTIGTTGLSQGTYELVAQGKMQGGTIESDKSARKTIGIGVSVADDTCLARGDLNCDGFVNLVDFSILLFNWNTSSAVADINGDGTVSLPDFSIMLYYWTG